MANTVDTLGEVGTIDAIVDGSITELIDDRVYSVQNAPGGGSYQLRKLPNLVTLSLPNCTYINMRYETFQSLVTFDVKHMSDETSNRTDFLTSPQLTHVLFRSTVRMQSLWGTISGPIYRGLGAVYVPSSLVSTYKADSSYANLRVEPLESYPITDWSTIEGTWADIIDSIEDGTFSGQVGDIKLLNLGTEQVYMVLSGIDQDALASDGTTRAKTSWTSLNVLSATHKMADTASTAGGWASSSMRSYLANDVMPLLPSALRSGIKEVRKYTGVYDSGTSKDHTTNDKLWIPSLHEVTGSTNYETQGGVYTGYYNSSSGTLTKFTRTNTSTAWVTRSAYTDTQYVAFGTTGAAGGRYANMDSGICLGFCI